MKTFDVFEPGDLVVHLDGSSPVSGALYATVHQVEVVYNSKERAQTLVRFKEVRAKTVSADTLRLYDAEKDTPFSPSPSKDVTDNAFDFKPGMWLVWGREYVATRVAARDATRVIFDKARRMSDGVKVPNLRGCEKAWLLSQNVREVENPKHQVSKKKALFKAGVWITWGTGTVAMRIREVSNGVVSFDRAADVLGGTPEAQAAEQQSIAYLLTQNPREISPSSFGTAAKPSQSFAVGDWITWGREIYRTRVSKIDNDTVNFDEAREMGDGSPYRYYERNLTMRNLVAGNVRVVAAENTEKKWPPFEVGQWITWDHEKFALRVKEITPEKVSFDKGASLQGSAPVPLIRSAYVQYLKQQTIRVVEDPTQKKEDDTPPFKEGNWITWGLGLDRFRVSKIEKDTVHFDEARDILNGSLFRNYVRTLTMKYLIANNVRLIEAPKEPCDHATTFERPKYYGQCAPMETVCCNTQCRKVLDTVVPKRLPMYRGEQRSARD